MGSPIEVRLLPELPDSNGEFYFRRISIVGGSGAGKSSLALRLGGIMKSRVVHLDKEFFLPGWTKPLLKDWKDKVSQLTSGETLSFQSFSRGFVQPGRKNSLSR